MKTLHFLLMLLLVKASEPLKRSVVPEPEVQRENAKVWSQPRGEQEPPAVEITGPGPLVKQTNGEIWPKPQLQAQEDGTVLTFDVPNFEFELDKTSSTCDIVAAAVARYFPRFFPSVTSNDGPKEPPRFFNDISWTQRIGGGIISKLEIFMNNSKGCEKYPHAEMDEHYEIKVDTEDDPQHAKIIALSVWGILRGLESFSQLIYTNSEYPGLYFINRTMIMDFPRFSYRGILLDSSRHFISKKVLIENLDLMEINKMNAFHWHLVDDQSFPYDSSTYPELSKKGAYQPVTHVYTQADVFEVIEEARLRGIRVIPEFDTPGHTQSWELGQPGLLAVCNGTNLSTYGPMNPIKQFVYDFLSSFFKEIYSVFPDKYLHIGGDEVDVTCWQSNTEIQEFAAKHNITDYKELESLFIQKLFAVLDALQANKTYVVWEEVFVNGDQVTPETIIEVWKKENWEGVVYNVTQKGLRTILSSPWYLNYISYGSDAMKLYLEDPQAFGGTEQQERLVIGGEACMWGEYVNNFNLIPRLWPRASAVAERLWSARDVRDVKEATPRLQEHECRMIRRGYPVEPAIGPGFCDGE